MYHILIYDTTHMIKSEQTFISNTVEKTKEMAQDFSKKLKKGDVVALYGNLGAGKTTFVQGLAKGLGIKKRIISPTFVIVRTYRILNNKSGIRNLYHIDLYRLENEKELQELGLGEILNDKNAIIAIEWAEKLGSLLKLQWEIKCEYINENTRQIKLLKKS